jgi:hypothetical protein
VGSGGFWRDLVMSGGFWCTLVGSGSFWWVLVGALRLKPKHYFFELGGLIPLAPPKYI